MDVPTHWTFLCLDILLLQGTNLAELTTHDWQVCSALLSLFPPPSITLILGSNWVTCRLFLIILEGSNLNCGRNKKLYILSYVVISAPPSVRRDLKHLFRALIRCYFPPQNLFVRIIHENMITIYFWYLGQGQWCILTIILIPGRNKITTGLQPVLKHSFCGSKTNLSDSRWGFAIRAKHSAVEHYE